MDYEEIDKEAADKLFVPLRQFYELTREMEKIVDSTELTSNGENELEEKIEKVSETLSDTRYQIECLLYELPHSAVSDERCYWVEIKTDDQ